MVGICSGVTVAVDLSRSFCWIIQWDQPVIFNAMAFSPMLRRDVGCKWADVPQSKVKDVGHFMDGLRSAAVRLWRAAWELIGGNKY
jgi:hypothetical protein